MQVGSWKMWQACIHYHHETAIQLIKCSNHCEQVSTNVIRFNSADDLPEDVILLSDPFEMIHGCGWMAKASKERRWKMKHWCKNFVGGGGCCVCRKEAPARSTCFWLAQFKWLHSRMHQSEVLPLLCANVVVNTWCLWSRLLARWFVLAWITHNTIIGKAFYY